MKLKAIMNYSICFGLFLLLSSNFFHSQIIETYTIRSNSVCSGDNSLVITSAAQIPSLSGRSIKQISLLNYSQESFQKIVFRLIKKIHRVIMFLIKKMKKTDPLQGKKIPLQITMNCFSEVKI